MSRAALDCTAVPPAIPVGPSPSILLAARLAARLAALDPGLEPDAIVLRAVAAEVFAVSIIFRKKPLFFAFGAMSPPNGSAPSGVFSAMPFSG
jgi:hypothetical protein